MSSDASFMTALRAEAERRLSAVPDVPSSTSSPLVHELQLHQIELELQNDTLREAQLALEHSLARYHELFQLAPVGCVTLSENTTIQEANSAALATLGGSAEQVIGKRLSSFVAASHVTCFTLHRQEVLDHKSIPREVELELVPIRGSSCRVRISSARGAQTPWLMTLVDITELSALQRRAQHLQHAESLTTLAGGVAHDFNNVFTAVLAGARLALSQLGPETPAKQALHDLMESTQHGLAITAQLRTASRGAGRASVIDLHEALRACTEGMRTAAGSAVNIDLVLEAATPRVRFDPGLLGQVMLDLARNAGDAMGGQGTLRIETREPGAADADLLQGAAAVPGPSCVICISDMGGGLSTEARERAFEPFFTTKPRDQGTGLGLWVVQGAVLHAGGNIRLDNRRGGGTSVRIHLPCVT